LAVERSKQSMVTARRHTRPPWCCGRRSE
jgi:hypothetical protein